MSFSIFLNLQIFSLTMPLQGSVMTLEFWNLCNFLYSFENYLILIVSIVYSYIMLLHILISENFKLWAFWSLNTISWSSKCFLATGQFAYFGWVWYSYCCQNLAVFTEPCHTPAAGSCKTLVLLVKYVRHWPHLQHMQATQLLNASHRILSSMARLLLK